MSNGNQSFFGKQTMMINPIKLRRNPPNIHPGTLLFLCAATIGHTIILMIVFIIPINEAIAIIFS